MLGSARKVKAALRCGVFQLNVKVIVKVISRDMIVDNTYGTVVE
jgi:hypothetical protein